MIHERSDINFKIEIAKKIFLVVAIATVLFFTKSIMGLIWVWVAYTILSLMTTAVISSRVAGYKIKYLVKDIAPYFFVALLSAVVSTIPLFIFSNSWVQLITSSAIFAILYISIVALFKMEVWLECWSLAKRKLGITKQ